MMELKTAEALILAIGALGLGIVMLIRGGNWTIDSAVYLANKFGISPLIVGFTVVAFGTSLPELVVSLNAHLHGSSGIAFGNVLGSNIANILLVIGGSALVMTLHAHPRRLARDMGMMLAATALLAGLMVYGDIGRLTGIGMVGILILYTFWQYTMARRGEIEVETPDVPVFSTMQAALLSLLGGLIFITLGAEFLVRGARTGALVLGVPEGVIGLSIIAFGTSLPELSTCLVAARKNHTDIILGNILGSNVFNILMILGITATIKPLTTATIAPQFVQLDIWVTVAVSFAFALLLLVYRKVNKPLGFLFIIGYAAYILTMYALYMT